MTFEPLLGKNVLITGASRGLGAAIAGEMWNAGANLMLVARSEKGLTDVISGLPSRSSQVVHSFSVDLSDSIAVEKILESAHLYFDRLDVLVNNAAIQGPVGPSWENNWEVWNATLKINLEVPADLSRRCGAWMAEKKTKGKIVSISGGGATGSRPNFSAYAVAKTGLVRFCEILADELAPYQIQVNCISPGIMATSILNDVIAAGPERAGQKEYASALRATQEGGTSMQRPAQLAVFLASSASDGLTGKLISAVWDPWENFSAHIDELKGSDIYTLRRIVPKDRGLAWGDR